MARKSSNIKQALPQRVSLPRKAKPRASYPPPGDAAARVFSIPELLEQILPSDLDWDSFYVHKETGARLVFIQVCGQYSTAEWSCFKQAIADLPHGWKYSDASWRNIKLCNAKDSIPLILRVRRGDRPWDLIWDMGHFELDWYLRGDDTLGYVFNLFLQLFEHIDAIRVARGNMQTKLEEIKQEKAVTEGKWRQEFEQPRKIGGNRGVTSHRATMNARKKLWEESEKELAAELKKTTRAWWKWKWAVEKEQNAKKRQLHPKSVWRHGSEA
ncbi:hypothetical protein CBER1_10032 [Cercospora berteroae]|uniref:Uncharacterized protein n=1 Tax=Cercospora berteroae TaxID=357750 RepID=A0A2S6BX78_9PEZI|nr:hypothetical protein CBER1_10032 [Cercospora berteroae]